MLDVAGFSAVLPKGPGSLSMLAKPYAVQRTVGPTHNMLTPTYACVQVCPAELACQRDLFVAEKKGGVGPQLQGLATVLVTVREAGGRTTTIQRVRPQVEEVREEEEVQEGREGEGAEVKVPLLREAAGALKKGEEEVAMGAAEEEGMMARC